MDRASEARQAEMKIKSK